MSGASGQAAGLAVGAAVGAVLSPVGAVASGALAGATIGSSAVGLYEEHQYNKIQSTLDESALRLNEEQARLKAAEQSAIHATNFRKALASQVSLAAMRGGSGSLTRQFAQESYRNFIQDQKAIESGLKLAEVQGKFNQANLSANNYIRDIRALTRFGTNVASGINLNLLAPRETNG